MQYIVLLDSIARDCGDVPVVLRELYWSLRRFHISSTTAINYPISHQVFHSGHCCLEDFSKSSKSE